MRGALAGSPAPRLIRRGRAQYRNVVAGLSPPVTPDSREWRSPRFHGPRHGAYSRPSDRPCPHRTSPLAGLTLSLGMKDREAGFIPTYAAQIAVTPGTVTSHLESCCAGRPLGDASLAAPFSGAACACWGFAQLLVHVRLTRVSNRGFFACPRRRTSALNRPSCGVGWTRTCWYALAMPLQGSSPRRAQGPSAPALQV